MYCRPLFTLCKSSTLSYFRASQRSYASDVTYATSSVPNLKIDDIMTHTKFTAMSPIERARIQREAYKKYLENPEISEVDGVITYQDRIDYFGDPQRDPIQLVHNASKDWVYEKLQITPEKKAEFDSKFRISSGNDSLEWCLGSPPTFHIFDELPIIKIDE